MNKLILITYLALICQSEFLFAKNLGVDTIKITQEDFLKKAIYGKVKSVTINKKHYRDNQLEQEPYEKSVYTFNNKNDLVKIEYIDCIRKDTSTYYKVFDDKGNMIEERSSKTKSISYFFYDVSNRLTMEKSKLYDTLITTMQLKYDSFGRLIEKHQYGLICKYFYDNNNNNNNYVSYSIQDKLGKIMQTSSLEYDEYGNCIKEINKRYDNDKINESWIEYKYDKTKLISLKNSWAGEFLTFYNEIGSIVKQSYPNGDIYENEISYDKYLNEKQVTKYKNGKKIEVDEYYYEYID